MERKYIEKTIENMEVQLNFIKKVNDEYESKKKEFEGKESEQHVYGFYCGFTTRTKSEIEFLKRQIEFLKGALED